MHIGTTALQVKAPSRYDLRCLKSTLNPNK